MIYKLRQRDEAKRYIGILLIIVFHVFYLTFLPFRNQTWSRLAWILSAAGFVLYLPGVLGIMKKYAYLRFELIYIYIIQVIICIFSMLSYGQNMFDMFICAGAYLYLLLTPLIILSFSRSGIRRTMSLLVILDTIYDVIVIICALIKNFTGIMALNIQTVTSKTANVRIATGALSPLVMVYLAYELLNEKKKIKPMVLLGINLFFVIYIEQTRVKEIAVIITLVAVAFSSLKSSKGRVLFIAVMVALTFMFVHLGGLDKLIASFSIDPKVNENYTSSLARVRAIQYFKSYTDDNVLFGMGYINPRTSYLRSIWSGPRQVFFFDDLGILGLFFKNGLLGISVFVSILFRMIFCAFRTKSKSNRIIMVGLLTFVSVSSISLSIFDGHRMPIVPFIIAISEYFIHGGCVESSEWHNNSEKKELVN